MTPAPDADMDRGGTDSAAALQALLDAGAPLPPGVFGVGSTLTRRNRKGAASAGAWRGRGGPTDPSVGTWLVWQGPPGGTLLDDRGMQYALEGVGFACARSTSLDRAVNVDAPDASSGLISTRHLYKNLAVDGRFGAISRGIVFGESQCANNEFMRLESCDFRGISYAGVHVPNGTDQSEAYQFEDVTFSECLHGYAGARSSGDFFRCNFSWCGVAFWLNGGTGRPIAFRSCVSEGCKQFLSAYGAYSVAVEDCRLAMNAAPAAPPVGAEFLYGGNHLALRRVQFEDAPTAAGFVRPTNGGECVAEDALFNSASPFCNDAQSNYRLRAGGVRLANGARRLPDGVYACGPYSIYPQLAQGQPAPVPLPAAGVAA